MEKGGQVGSRDGNGHPLQTRRRGQTLEGAILSAALDELVERGYERSTMEGIAERAKTGKSSLYRRWQTKWQLVLDALVNALPKVDDEPPEFGSLREDLMYLLVRMTRGLEQPAGRILRSMIVEGRPPELVAVLDKHLIQPRIQLIVAAMRRAADRGEISVASPVLLISQVGPAMIMHQQLLRGSALSDDDIAEIVDLVIFPALRASSTK
jgi:AcrR family transcriptional regulator